MGRGGEKRREIQKGEKVSFQVSINLGLNFLCPNRNRVTVTFLLFTILFLFPTGCNKLGNLSNNVIAEVNKESITLDEFNKEFKGMVIESKTAIGDTNNKNLKETLLNQMIERKILLQEARRLGISVSKEEIDMALREITIDYKEEDFFERLRLIGMSFEEWGKKLEERLLAEKMIRSASNYTGEISEKEAKKFYENNRSYFQLPQIVRARQVVLSDGEEAIQVLKRLKKGESFDKLAREKSIAPERDKGGDLGYFSRGERPSEFDYVFEMEVGKISDVIKTPYGYHIFKLEEKIEAKEIPFVEVKNKIIETIAKEKGEEKFEEWFRELKKKTRIKINKELLN